MTTWSATALSADDNVATLLQAVEQGERVIVRTGAGDIAVTALEPIALCHKIALRDIAPGESVFKYGECIGEATAAIARGGWVHVHNVRSRRARAPEASP